MTLKFIELSADAKEAEDAIDDALTITLTAATSCLSFWAQTQTHFGVRQNSEQVEITERTETEAQSGLAKKRHPTSKIRRGALIRGGQNAQRNLEIT
jgi:hypothetical protein